MKTAGVVGFPYCCQRPIVVDYSSEGFAVRLLLYRVGIFNS